MEDVEFDATDNSDETCFRSGQVPNDVMAYEHLLSEAEMTEAERRQFLEAMWCVIVTLMRSGVRIRDPRIQERRAA